MKISKDDLRFLTFSLGTELYGVPLLSVREVIAVPHFTSIPNAPKHFMGIFNLRGQVLSVIDLRKKLNIVPKKDNEEESVIIFEIDSVRVGVLVDNIEQVLQPGAQDMSPIPSTDPNSRSKYISEVFRKGDRLIPVIDIEKALDFQDIKMIKNKDIPA